MSEETSNPAEQSASPAPADAKARQRSFARRAILQAGWIMPATIMLALPKSASAAPPSAHSDFSSPPTFNDAPPSHGDAVPHGDNTIGPPHSDAVHNDFGGGGFPPGHSDLSHNDAGSPGPPHSDV